MYLIVKFVNVILNFDAELPAVVYGPVISPTRNVTVHNFVKVAVHSLGIAD